MSVAGITETTQYLTFKLDEEIFALDISKVKEVLDFTEITKIPQTPDFMKGVINLRGGVVPVVDMRLKFGMSETVRTVNTCIIIVEVTIDEKGNVVATNVLHTIGFGIDEIIVATVRNWHYLPARVDGMPVASREDVHFHFPV